MRVIENNEKHPWNKVPVILKGGVGDRQSHDSRTTWISLVWWNLCLM